MAIATFTYQLDTPGLYTYDLLNDAGVSVLNGAVTATSPTVISGNFTIPDDAKLHLYKLRISQAGCPDSFVTGLLGSDGSPADTLAFTANTRELIVDGQQFLRVELSGGPTPLGLIDYRLFSKTDGSKVIELIGQNNPYSIQLPNLRGTYFVTATARRGTTTIADDSYASKVVEFTGIGVTTTNPTTSVSPTTSLVSGCFLYTVINGSSIDSDISFVNCNGEFDNSVVLAGQSTQICVLNGQYSSANGSGISVTPTGTQCTAGGGSSSTTSASTTETLSVLSTTVNEGNTGSMAVRVFLSYFPSTLGPFNVTVQRVDNSVPLGQVTGVAYPSSGGIVVPISDYTGAVLVRAIGTKGTSGVVDDLTASRTIYVAPVTATTTSTSSSTTSAGGTTSAGTTSSSSSSSSTTSAAFAQRILRIQVKRQPNGDINGNNKGVAVRVQTAGGYVPRMFYSKTGYGDFAFANEISSFVDGSYQYGNVISLPPFTGSMYITFGYMTTNNDTYNVLVDNVSVQNSDWITVYDINGIPTTTSSSSTTSAAPTLGITLGYAWDGGSGNYSFAAYANRSDGNSYQARIVPLSGQANPTSAFANMETGTYSAYGYSANLRLLIPPIFITPPGANPGNWQLEIKRLSDGAIRTCPFTLVAGVNSGGEICPGGGGGTTSTPPGSSSSSSSSTTSATPGMYYPAGLPITVNV